MNEKLENLIKEYRNPSLDYNPVMMWFWNGEIDEAGITFQLEKFREQNVVQFFIHSAGGMTVPYMSERYLELIRHVVKEAKRLGMKYWIYDENDWPSGMVGGFLLEQYPEYEQKEIYCEKVMIPNAGLGMRAYVSRRGKFLCAQRMLKKQGRYFVTDVTDLCEVTVDGNCVNVQYQSRSLLDEEVLFYFSEHSDRVIYASLGRLDTKGVRGYVNILREETVAKFIEMTHEKYKEAIGEEFGKTVMGVFTDEPTSLYRFDGAHPGPWDEQLFEMFEEDHGYSLKPYLYALFYEPLSPEEIKAREDYRETVTRRYHRAFIKQVADWCHANNLLFTGHFGGEEDLGGQVAQGDMQTEAMYMDIPGLDSIHSAKAIKNYNFNVAGKLIASAAKYKDADRVLCETYTLSGWDLSFPVMRRIANRLLCLGANMIQYMGAAYSLYASRKHDAGPPHNYMNPMFQHYHAFNKYVAGLSVISAATKPDAGVMVFNPIKQMIQKYDYLDVRHRSECMTVQRIYEDTVNALLLTGISFDLISEELVDNITVKDGYAEAFGYCYDCFVFPDMYFVTGKTAALIRKLKKNGVKMIFAHEVPTKVVDAMAETGLTFDGEPWSADNITGSRPAGGADVHVVDSSELCMTDSEVLADGNMYLVNPMNWPITLDSYRKVLKDLIGNVSLNIEAEGRVYIAQRSNDYCKAYFICNDEDQAVETRIDAVPGMKILNTTSGEAVTYPIKDERLQIVLEPYEMIVVLCDSAAADDKSDCGLPEEGSPAEEITLDSTMGFEVIGGNVLPVFWEMYDKETGTWEQGSELFFPANIRLRLLEEYKLRSQVTFEYVPEKIYINAEIYGVTGLRINGKEVPLAVNTRYWSEYDCKCDVSELIHEGINYIELDGTTERTYGWAMPPFTFFSGDFRVSDHNTVIEPCACIKVGSVSADIAKAGGWEKQGYPRFSGTAVYETAVEVQSDFRKAELEIPCEDPVKVYVNGEWAGLILWKPHKLDISDLLKNGNNSIELRVTSTLGNICDGPGVTGLTKPMKLRLYNE